MGGQWVHRLIERDISAMTGVCKECGPTTLRREGKGLTANGQQYHYYCETGYILKYKKKRTKLVQSHGLTSIEATEFKKDKCCEICGTTENLRVDHCHKTGKIRGVLCNSHNVALGFFHDSVEELQKAIDYLNR